MRNRQKGYNLVEVLIALALTGVVILSIMTLFFLGRRNVYSGKQMTAANAVATRVLEDLSMMSATDVLTNFGITDAATTANNTVAGVSYPGSILRDSRGTVNSTTDPSGYLTRWQALVNAQANFNNGRLVLVITPASMRTANAETTAQVVRVRGILEWSEGLRRRNITFEASKLQRP